MFGEKHKQKCWDNLFNVTPKIGVDTKTFQPYIEINVRCTLESLGNILEFASNEEIDSFLLEKINENLNTYKEKFKC